MSAMVLDAAKVNSYVIPNLAKLQTTLKEASQICNTLSRKLPSTSAYNGKISSVNIKINNITGKVSTVTNKINSKLAKASSIERKNQSKVSSIASAVAAAGLIGATAATGAAVTGGVAAAGIAGATIGLASRKTLSETGAISAGKTTSKTQNIFSKAFDFMKETGAKVAKKVNSGWNKFTSTVKKVSEKGKKIVTTTINNLKNTQAKVAEKVTSFTKNLVDGTKKTIEKVKTGCKKIAQKTKSVISEKILPALKKRAEFVINIHKKRWELYKKTACTVVNTAASLLEGIVSFGEAIVDVGIMAGGALFTALGTAPSDIVSGLVRGEWSFQNTKALWAKKIMPAVGYDFTGTAFDKLYDTKLFSAIENNARKWVKREDGIVYKVGKGVGYVVGVVALSTVTAGVGAAATSAASTASSSIATKALTLVGKLGTKTAASTFLAGLGKAGKAADAGYNDVIDSQVKAHYIEQLKLQNPSLSNDELDKLYNTCKEEGAFKDYDKVRKSYMDNISGKKIAGIIASSTVQGGIEAATWYVTYGGGGKNILAKEGSKLGTKVKGIDKLGQLLTNKDTLIRSGKYLNCSKQQILNKILPSINVASFTKAGIQVAKEYGNEAATVLYDSDMDWKKAGTNAAVSGATSILYDNTFGSWFGKLTEKATDITARKEAAKAAADTFDDIADVADDHIAKNATQDVSKGFKDTLKEKLDDAIVNLTPIFKYAGKNDDGKKVVGTGLKTIYKEGEKTIIKAFADKIGGE